MNWLFSFFAKKLPYSLQRMIEDTCCTLISKLKIDRVIKFKGFTLKIPMTDIEASQIYFRYLLTGTWRHENYEQTVVEEIIATLDSVFFIDAGANYGLYSLIAVSCPSVQTVIAVEASPKTYKYLKNTIDLNNLNEKITVKNAAIADKSGISYQVTNLENSAWNSVIESTNQLNKDVILSTSIDDLIPFNQISKNTTIFIKIDIEGGEPKAFDGMTKLLASSFNYIILFEFHIGLLSNTVNSVEIFAQKIWDHCHNNKLLRVDSSAKKLVPIDSIDEFNKLIESRKTADFPNNLFNLLIINRMIEL